MPEILAILLSLYLFVFGFLADHPDLAVSAHDLALITDFLY